MKTTNVTGLPLHYAPTPAISLEGIRWKVRGGPGAGRSVMTRLGSLLLRFCLAMLRTLAVLLVAALAVVDAIVTRIVAVPTGVGMARARARWLHRWSRALRWVIGVKFELRGVMPPSGIVAANYTFFLDAILLAAVGPCVFVACAEVRRWPVIGFLAHLGGTLFVDPRRRGDVARVNFLIERAVRRRLLIVIFSGSDASEGAEAGAFASGLLEAAVELRCSLTAAAFAHHVLPSGEYAGMTITHRGGLFQQFAQLVGRWRPLAIGAFYSPTFHQGDRKRLASQLRIEALELIIRIATPGGITRHSKRARLGN